MAHGKCERTSTFYLRWTWPPGEWFWTMINGLSRELVTKMRKPASIFVLLLLEIPSGWLERCRWNVSCLVVGPGVKISSFCKQERGRNVWSACIYGTKCRQLVLGDNMALVLTLSVSLEVATLCTHRHPSPRICLHSCMRHGHCVKGDDE